MARIVSDWRIDFMRAHPRLFDLMTDEPERSFGYPLCDAGWRDALERLCTRIEDAETGKPEEPTTRHAHSNIRSTNIYMPSAISWKLLLKAQAVPTRRNPLRKNGTKLSRRRHSRSHRPMAAVIRTGAKSAGSSRGLPSISAVLLRVCEPQNPSLLTDAFKQFEQHDWWPWPILPPLRLPRARSRQGNVWLAEKG